MATFSNDINKVADMLLCGKKEFLKSYSYLTEKDFYDTIRNVLYNNFSFEEREDYKHFLISEGEKEYAELILD